MQDLPAYDPESKNLNVIIETPRGSRNKYKYAEKQGIFKLSSLLPKGLMFPYDFGFVPSTKAPDGDPIDILILMDEPTAMGCLVPARPIGVIEVEQTEDGKTNRNDRLIAVAAVSQFHKDLNEIDQLSSNLLDEIEHFFVSYAEPQGKKLKILGRSGANRANELIRKAAKARD